MARTLVISVCLIAAGRSFADENEFRAIPDVQGQPPAIARQLLRLSELELTHGVFYIAAKHWRADIRPGVLYLQTPPPRTPLRRGGMVAGWAFARAEESREVVATPDLKGADVADAREKLAASGLFLMQRGQASLGVVADQYPRPGQRVLRGTHVFASWGTEAE